MRINLSKRATGELFMGFVFLIIVGLALAVFYFSIERVQFSPGEEMSGVPVLTDVQLAKVVEANARLESEKQQGGCENLEYDFVSPVSAEASSYSSRTRKPEKAIDTKEIRRRYKYSSWKNNRRDKKPWIVFDLGGEKCVNGIKIYTRLANKYLPISGKISVSSDGENWEVVKDNFEVNKYNKKKYELQEFDSIVKVRYVRLDFESVRRTYVVLYDVRVGVG